MPNNRKYSKIISNAYYDSVTLMRCATRIQALPGIGKVALMMGTPANQVLMQEQDMWAEGDGSAGPTDLCVSMLYESDEALALAIKALDDFIAGQDIHPNSAHTQGSHSAIESVRSWKEAAYVLDDPKVAAISLPGAWAAAEARQALDEGFHVFLYSDNVSLDEELALKQYARDRELIVMGPDCGTALIGGAPLGFINRLGAGRVGIIAASGTGAQEVSTGLDRAGVGVSSIIGIGSHDLTDRIGGISFRTALEWFREDDNTVEVAIVAKPPDEGVLKQLQSLLESYPKPISALFLGHNEVQIRGLKTAHTIGELISMVGETEMERPPALPPVGPGQYVRGLFVGGTLAIQASLMLGIPLANEGLRPWVQAQHVIVDLGDDRFTVGRPHPMMDGTGRGEAIAEVLTDPRTGIVVGDIVLGDGAEEDPVLHVLTAIKVAAGQREPLPPIVFTVVGTHRDPQNYESQVTRLRGAGVWVTETSTAAIQAIKHALGGQVHE